MAANQFDHQPTDTRGTNSAENHQMEQLRTECEQLKQLLQAVQSERDQLRQSLVAVEAERDDYRKVAYAWAREQFSKQDFEPFDESDAIPIEEVLRQLDDVGAEGE